MLKKIVKITFEKSVIITRIFLSYKNPNSEWFWCFLHLINFKYFGLVLGSICHSVVLSKQKLASQVNENKLVKRGILALKGL